MTVEGEDYKMLCKKGTKVFFSFGGILLPLLKFKLFLQLDIVACILTYFFPTLPSLKQLTIWQKSFSRGSRMDKILMKAGKFVNLLS